MELFFSDHGNIQIFVLFICLNSLKGLDHAILGNFSIDQMVIELTKISQWLKTMEDLKQNTGKPSRDMNGQNWRGLRGIAFG